MTKTRRHHYVPKSYLAGFTPSGSDDDRLTVTDIKIRSQRQQLPSQVAFQRDYNRVEVEGLPANMIEDFFANELEDKAAPILKKLSVSPRLPSDEELQTLLNLVATQAVRVPAFRNVTHIILNTWARKTMEQLTSSQEAYDAELEKIRKDGGEVPNLPLEEFRKHLKSVPSFYDPKSSRTWLVGQELKAFQTIRSLLDRRAWSIYVAAPGAPDFITSDNPVFVVPSSDMPPFLRPGFAWPGTSILFPLAKRVLLFGTDVMEAQRLTVSAEIVERCNSAQIEGAHQFIFSTTKEIRWRGEKDESCGTAELLEALISKQEWLALVSPPRTSS